MKVINISGYLTDITGIFINQLEVKQFCDVNGFKPSEVAYLKFDPNTCRFCFVFKKSSSFDKLYFAKSYLLAMIKYRW